MFNRRMFNRPKLLAFQREKIKLLLNSLYFISSIIFYSFDVNNSILNVVKIMQNDIVFPDLKLSYLNHIKNLSSRNTKIFS